MKIAFYSNRLEFDGDTLFKKGLGGSESALINISSTWKQMCPDDEITIYNGNKKRDTTYYFGVEYKTTDDLLFDSNKIKYDAFISLRDYTPFTMKFLNATVKCLWSQDDMNEVALQNLYNNPYARENIDCIFAISEYAKNNIKSAFTDKTVKLLRNGYRDDWIQNNNNFRNPVAVYTSTPFRGLDLLNDFWPEIYNGVIQKINIAPELKIFTGMSLYQQPETNFQSLYDSLKSKPNVTLYNAFPQKQLYNELYNCKVMLYPNHFLETGCMAVLEALANGVWTVTTDLGALGEQVVDNVSGYLIKEHPHSAAYKEKFIEKSIEALSTFPLFPKTNGLIFSWREQTKKLKDYITDILRGVK